LLNSFFCTRKFFSLLSTFWSTGRPFFWVILSILFFRLGLLLYWNTFVLKTVPQKSKINSESLPKNK
jgi:hypothetical protein